MWRRVHESNKNNGDDNRMEKGVGKFELVGWFMNGCTVRRRPFMIHGDRHSKQLDGEVWPLSMWVARPV